MTAVVQLLLQPAMQSAHAPHLYTHTCAHARTHDQKDDVPLAMSEDNQVRKKIQKDDVPLAMSEVNEILSEMIKV